MSRPSKKQKLGSEAKKQQSIKQPAVPCAQHQQQPAIEMSKQSEQSVRQDGDLGAAWVCRQDRTNCNMHIDINSHLTYACVLIVQVLVQVRWTLGQLVKLGASRPVFYGSSPRS